MATQVHTCGDSPRRDNPDIGSPEKAPAAAALGENNSEIIGESETIEAAATNQFQILRRNVENVQVTATSNSEPASGPNDATNAFSLLGPKELDQSPTGVPDSKDSDNQAENIQNEACGTSQQKMPYRVESANNGELQHQEDIEGSANISQDSQTFVSRLSPTAQPFHCGYSIQYGYQYISQWSTQYSNDPHIHSPTVSSNPPPIIEIPVTTLQPITMIMRERGEIISLCKTYGFITLNNGSGLLFFHFSQYLGSLVKLRIGDYVEFSRTHDTLTGRPWAINMFKLRYDNPISDERFIGHIECEPLPGYPVPSPGRITSFSRGQIFEFIFYKSSVENFTNVRVGDRVNFRVAGNRIGQLCAYYIRLMTPGLVVYDQPIPASNIPAH